MDQFPLPIGHALQYHLVFLIEADQLIQRHVINPSHGREDIQRRDLDIVLVVADDRSGPAYSPPKFLLRNAIPFPQHPQVVPKIKHPISPRFILELSVQIYFTRLTFAYG